MSAMLNEGAGESEGRAAQKRVRHLHRDIAVQSHAEQVWVAMQSVRLQLQLCDGKTGQGARQRQLQAGKSPHLWQAAGACGLFNTPANSYYVMRIRDNPNPDPAPTGSQGGFQWRILGLSWTIPRSPSHLQLQRCGAVGDFARKSSLDHLPWGLRELSTQPNTQGHKHPENQ